MNEYEITVTVEYEDGTEEEIEIDIDSDLFLELESDSKRVEYIKSLAKKGSEDIKKVLFDKDDLNDLKNEIDDMNDTSWAHPNETWEEYVEHEDFE